MRGVRSLNSRTLDSFRRLVVRASPAETLIQKPAEYRRPRAMPNEVVDVWKNADCVCFDVDSTVITEEGIDEMAKYFGRGQQVSELTQKAMTGTMLFQDSLKMRLSMIKPQLNEMKMFVRSSPTTFTPGIKKLVEELQKRNVPVYLVSGGFRCLVGPIAQQLGIPPENVYANRLKFYYTGEYAGFDEDEPTSKSGGKGTVIEGLKRIHGYKRLVLIGDGVTDLEASPPADAFIGYGGNVIREEVKLKAKWFVTDFNELFQNMY